MRALVAWAHPASTNLGLHVLAEGTAELVRRAWPDAEVEFQDYGKGSAPMSIGSPKSLAREWVTGRRGLKQWLRDFDVVIDTRSGDSFADIYGLPRLFAMNAFAEFARRSGVPVVLGPQTIGPFATLAGGLLGRQALRSASNVMARDSASADASRTLAREPDAVTTDVVFALPALPRTGTRDVILNVSGLLWNPGPHVDASEYRRIVADLYRELERAGRRVSLLAHVLDSPRPDNDVPALREFRALHAPDAELLIPESLADVRGMLASGTVVVGSRMHACLNALSTGTPAVPLAYSRKFAPLFGDIDWPHTVDLRSAADPVGEVLASVTDPQLDAQVAHTLGRAEQLLDVAVGALTASRPAASVESR